MLLTHLPLVRRYGMHGTQLPVPPIRLDDFVLKEAHRVEIRAVGANRDVETKLGLNMENSGCRCVEFSCLLLSRGKLLVWNLLSKSLPLATATVV
jgi:hypothetical protein